MRTLITIALVATASFTSFAQAQSAAAPDAASVRIQGVASMRTPMTEEQFADIGGKYMLSNGKQLTVSSNNYHYFAHIDGQREVEIVPTAYKQFVAANADMQINFDELRGGQNTDVVIRTGMRENRVSVLASR
jgi:hypothetical protein